MKKSKSGQVEKLIDKRGGITEDKAQFLNITGKSLIPYIYNRQNQA